MKPTRMIIRRWQKRRLREFQGQRSSFLNGRPGVFKDFDCWSWNDTAANIARFPRLVILYGLPIDHNDLQSKPQISISCFLVFSVGLQCTVSIFCLCYIWYPAILMRFWLSVPIIPLSVPLCSPHLLWSFCLHHYPTPKSKFCSDHEPSPINPCHMLIQKEISHFLDLLLGKQWCRAQDFYFPESCGHIALSWKGKGEGQRAFSAHFEETSIRKRSNNRCSQIRRLESFWQHCIKRWLAEGWLDSKKIIHVVPFWRNQNLGPKSHWIQICFMHSHFHCVCTRWDFQFLIELW